MYYCCIQCITVDPAEQGGLVVLANHRTPRPVLLGGLCARPICPSEPLVDRPPAIKGDRHLVRMREARVSWMPALPFRFEQDAIYTLRGPRQVGKSTVLKRQIRELIAAGWPPRQILYLDVELAGLERGADLVAALRTYSGWGEVPGRAGPGEMRHFPDCAHAFPSTAATQRHRPNHPELLQLAVQARSRHLIAPATWSLALGGEKPG